MQTSSLSSTPSLPHHTMTSSFSPNFSLVFMPSYTLENLSSLTRLKTETIARLLFITLSVLNPTFVPFSSCHTKLTSPLKATLSSLRNTIDLLTPTPTFSHTFAHVITSSPSIPNFGSPPKALSPLGIGLSLDYIAFSQKIMLATPSIPVAQLPSLKLECLQPPSKPLANGPLLHFKYIFAKILFSFMLSYSVALLTNLYLNSILYFS
jgi:hypothetical protein